MQTIYEGDGTRFIGWLLVMLDEHPERASELESLASEDRLPSSLVPLAVKTYEVLLKTTDSTERRAELLNILSVCLSNAGETARAFASIEEAVAIRRRLAHEQPQRFEPISPSA